jgi:predicted Ser/Thr protein kinase
VRYRRGVGSDRDQDLARTATAVASAPPGAADAVGATLGRYRLERELGAGAMGVVHAAFDPDLERRIALKVLRSATAPRESKDRLMREARAMARLSHTNVVTVHEVGTAEGRDFVAMELIHGETLAEWLRSGHRAPAAIIDAFVAAGRGLAAAHAAGIVHRDFKPHNVLRSRDGRIVVTDFGLARETACELPAAIDAALALGRGTLEPGPPSSLAGLTMTGAVLGTPAYMAPEQWRGGAVTPATDQFAYCVALWEALGGERPYRGQTLEELRLQVSRGPAALDASRLPRRARGILRRGLHPDPALRWPSMDALLARLGPARRRPRLALAAGGGALVAAAALIVALPGADAPAPACQPPARDVNTVWSPAIAAAVRARASDAHALVLGAAYQGWQAARVEACRAAAAVRPAQLLCLDGALDRIDALRRAYAHAPGTAAEDLQAQLVDPEVCHKPAAPEVPRLTLAPTPDVLAAYALYARATTDPGPGATRPGDAELAALIAMPSATPCARMIATLAFEAASRDVPRARALMADAVGLADQCGDDRLHADVLIQDSPYHWELPMIGPRGEAAIRRAETAAARVMQPEIAIAVASLRRRVARRQGQWDEAFRLVETEIALARVRGLRVRELRAVISRNSMRLARAEPGDLEALAADVRAWRPFAAASHKAELARKLDVEDAKARFQLGDVAAAHADLVALQQSRPRSRIAGGSRRITGEVVDPRGRPIAGATVSAASSLAADSVGIGLPMFLDYVEDDLRIATSDDAGRFAIDDAAPVGAIAAQQGDRRSRPAPITDRVKLVLEPTRSVRGRVELGHTASTRVAIYAAAVGDPTGRFYLIAPVAPDGSFTLARVTVGAIRIGAAARGDDEFDTHIEYRAFPASPLPLDDVSLGLAVSARSLDVIVRSAVAAPLEGAEVVVLAGKQQVANLDDLNRLQTTGMQARFARPIVGENAPRRALDKIRRGDFVAHIDHVGPGDLTVCAVNFAGDLADPSFVQRMQAHSAQLAVKCEQIGRDAAVVVLDLPPQQRF